MSDEREIVIDFVARGQDSHEWMMVLVEQGPWNGPLEAELRRIQDRLYGCLDAILEGQLAQTFPESTGKSVVVRLDCYDVPRDEVEDFFQRFSGGVFSIEKNRLALERCKFVRAITFQVNFDLAPT